MFEINTTGLFYKGVAWAFPSATNKLDAAWIADGSVTNVAFQCLANMAALAGRHPIISAEAPLHAAFIGAVRMLLLIAWLIWTQILK